LVQFWNEYGEFRGVPAKTSTVGWRVFAGNAASDVSPRSASVNVAEIQDDRSSRNILWGVNHLGDVYSKGDYTLDGELNGIRWGGMLTDGDDPPGGTATGTVFLIVPA
jgi:hypothetical protein